MLPASLEVTGHEEAQKFSHLLQEGIRKSCDEGGWSMVSHQTLKGVERVLEENEKVVSEISGDIALVDNLVDGSKSEDRKFGKRLVTALASYCQTSILKKDMNQAGRDYSLKGSPGEYVC